MKITERISHAWNAFKNTDPHQSYSQNIGVGTMYEPQRRRFYGGNDRTIITAIYNRIAVDVSSVSVLHAKTDINGRYLSTINSPLNDVLTIEANKDQTSKAFMIDLVMTLLEEGVVAVVPVDTSIDPRKSNSYLINSLRVGLVREWFPDHVRVDLYNDTTGKREEITLPKKTVGIVENPFYSVMNEQNSILKRIIRKMNLLDVVDEQLGTGKLDLIIQVPYTIKSEARRQEAERRRKEIEMQLTGSKLGIGYTDATEKIQQLNRPLENNLLKQVEYMVTMLYSQLSMSEDILKGTADEKTMLNYINQTIEPILTAITSEFKRKFLTKTARTQGQSVIFVRDPFRLVPIANIADIADRFTRNEILSSNEFRGIIGYRPSDDPKADELLNKNIRPLEGQQPEMSGESAPSEEELSGIESLMDQIEQKTDSLDGPEDAKAIEDLIAELEAKMGGVGL